MNRVFISGTGQEGPVKIGELMVLWTDSLRSATGNEDLSLVWQDQEQFLIAHFM